MAPTALGPRSNGLTPTSLQSSGRAREKSTTKQYQQEKNPAAATKPKATPQWAQASSESNTKLAICGPPKHLRAPPQWGKPNSKFAIYGLPNMCEP